MLVEFAIAPLLLLGALLSLPMVMVMSLFTWITSSAVPSGNGRKTVVSLCPDLDKVSAFLKSVFEVDLQEHFVVVVDSPQDVSQFDPDLVVVADRESLETVREAVATPLVWINN